MLALALLSILLLPFGLPQHAQPGSPTELYRFVLVQAAPGRLPELIDLYKSRLPVVAAGGDELPSSRHARHAGPVSRTGDAAVVCGSLHLLQGGVMLLLRA